MEKRDYVKLSRIMDWRGKITQKSTLTECRKRITQNYPGQSSEKKKLHKTVEASKWKERITQQYPG
jgi:hypothetical protein